MTRKHNTEESHGIRIDLKIHAVRHQPSQGPPSHAQAVRDTAAKLEQCRVVWDAMM